MYRKKKKQPQSKLVKSIKVAALRAGAPVTGVDRVQKQSPARAPPELGELSQGCSGSAMSVPTHSSTENINKGAKQCQLKLCLLFKYLWAPVH